MKNLKESYDLWTLKVLLETTDKESKSFKSESK